LWRAIFGKGSGPVIRMSLSPQPKKKILGIRPATLVCKKIPAVKHQLGLAGDISTTTIVTPKEENVRT
jgi:hypothetical protein